jgi:Na+-transporting methylmalonyl-CoA/oxaloacetate decarboxylase gamma subunit
MPDIGSQAIDTLIGLAFVFFLLSLVASAVTEGIAWATKRRANDLEKGLRSLINDPAQLDALLDHPLLKQFAPASDPKSSSPIPATTAGSKKPRVPSYLAPRDFSLALLDTIAPPDSGTPGSRDLVAAAKAAVGSEDSQLPEDLRKQLSLLLEDAGDEIGDVRKSIEGWFNSAMDRVSGLYKRWSQFVILVIAILVTGVLNVSAVRVADRLWNDQAVRTSVANAATKAVEQQKLPPTAKPPESGAAAVAGKSVDDAIHQLNALKLPIGWGNGNSRFHPSDLVGWLITIIAISMGAPFWWDALNKLARLRTTGAKPSGSTGSGGNG